MIVTLLTDFGTADYFVGALKGAVLASNPEALVVDITHEVPPYDVEAGAYTLRGAFETFPVGTVHVGVVDPGVGSARRGIAVEGRGHIFVGPDNGLFGHVYERTGPCRVFQLTNTNYFRREVSPTFHGRDIFAPVAGALSRGVRADELGPEVFDFVRLPSAVVERAADGTLVGAVIHVDRFGNLVTNITPEELSDEAVARGAWLRIKGRAVRRFRRFFAEEAEGAGEPFAVWGSAGLLEVAVFRDSAARVLGVKRGDKVEVGL
ncbi:MAG: S-adenosyl-l-methionine hydroxide adenosyltransferase family protein [Pyrinomonadaceae bacterium]